jgi:hypothetical protein
MKPRRFISAILGGFLALGAVCYSEPLVLVEDGKAKAAIWHLGDVPDAAKELADYLGKMSGAQLEVKVADATQKPEPAAPAILVGHLAIQAGMTPPPKTVCGDGYRIQRKGNHVLMAGESSLEPPAQAGSDPKGKAGGASSGSTFFAACHFLERLGVRWFFDNEIGEVVPEMKTIAVDELDISETPDFISRSIWGPNWHAQTWKRRNRMGGLSMSTGHDWGHVPANVYGEKFPDYYALRGGKRTPGNWLCTSNKDVQRIFAESLCNSVKGQGVTCQSISPPDGRGFCECESCRALDDPAYFEPSSGSVCTSDRYQHFYNAIAAEVQKANPDAILNFYAYSDYSYPPKHVKTAPPNLCVWMAPIRFCRLHSMGNPNCESRQRLRGVVEGWHALIPKLGWREYNYNLAELTAPFSKVTIFREDIPYLHKLGCLGMNIETMALWHIYGPHTYLIAKLLWDAEADVDAIMDDFYTKFCGKAAPHVKAYWERIDKAYTQTNAHSGCFYSLHAVWTPELVAACEADLAAATKLADNELIARRIGMFRLGLENVKYYLGVREATNRCDFVKAKEFFDQWLAHMDKILQERIHVIGEYKRGYAPRFMGEPVNQGFERVTGDCALLVQLPDEWLHRYDPKDEGETSGWQKEGVGGEGWRKVKTYTATLYDQGMKEELTWWWYRTEVEVPEVPDGRRVFLWFAEIDGRTTRVFLNGELVGEGKASRKPLEVEITGKLRKGRNLVAVKIDHRGISELMLGGIIKPVMVYTRKDAAPKAP